MPFWIIARIVSGELLAGPIVHTIFVFGMRSPPKRWSAPALWPMKSRFPRWFGGLFRLANRKNDLFQN
jgi:hypothetical protein